MIRDFANEMVRDHTAVNDKALALVKKLGVTPEDNPVSKSLTEAADKKKAELEKLNGAAFDKAYIDNEVAYHMTVNGARARLIMKKTGVIRYFCKYHPGMAGEIAVGR